MAALMASSRADLMADSLDALWVVPTALMKAETKAAARASSKVAARASSKVAGKVSSKDENSAVARAFH